MLPGYNKSLQTQINLMSKIVAKNEILNYVLCKLNEANLKEYYVGAGCIIQTIWNHHTGKDLMYGIKDIDIGYWDEEDSSEKNERRIHTAVSIILKGCPIGVDVKNQARVHLWHHEHFGFAPRRYTSLEDAISTYPMTCTCMGIKRVGQRLKVFAPYGLNDIFGMIIRPNKINTTEEYYKQKAQSFKERWPDVSVLPWDYREVQINDN